MSTRDIALRCAAAMDRNLLRHRWKGDGDKRELYGIPRRTYERKSIDLIRQLDNCKSDEARRLILGKSERMREESR